MSPDEGFSAGFRARACAFRRRRLARSSAARRSARLGFLAFGGGDPCFGGADGGPRAGSSSAQGLLDHEHREEPDVEGGRAERSESEVG